MINIIVNIVGSIIIANDTVPPTALLWDDGAAILWDDGSYILWE